MLDISSYQLLETFAQGVVNGIKENIKGKQVTPFGVVDNTGEAAESLYYKIEDGRITVGSTWAYITVLEDGRKPGKFAPPDVIEKWVESKPLNSDISVKSLAFLINRKLKEEGSLIYRQGGHSGILSDFTNVEYVSKNLTEPLMKAMVDEITGLLFKKQA